MSWNEAALRQVTSAVKGWQREHPKRLCQVFEARHSPEVSIAVDVEGQTASKVVMEPPNGRRISAETEAEIIQWLNSLA